MSNDKRPIKKPDDKSTDATTPSGKAKVEYVEYPTISATGKRKMARRRK